MRTTLDIADDVLFAVKEVARRDKKTVGQAASELMRRGLSNVAAAQDVAAPEAGVDARFLALGFRTLPPRGGIVTNELIDRLREQEGV
ncbi:MAG: antitoxin [Rhodocyclaceae bacterium]|nr:antitoxin [Rhodocyclaceae bacterium]